MTFVMCFVAWDRPRVVPTSVCRPRMPRMPLVTFDDDPVISSFASLSAGP